MGEVKTVDARLELQFYPSGSSYAYVPTKEPTVGEKDAEDKKLGAVLTACDKLGLLFEQLLPTDGRTWWNDGKLQFEVVDGKVTTEEILKKINTKLEGCGLKHEQFNAIPADLSKHFVLTNQFSAFPSAMDTATDDDEPAVKFGATVAPPMIGTAAYYSPPEGPVFCCRTVGLTANEVPVSLTEANGTDGKLDVLLLAHFKTGS